MPAKADPPRRSEALDPGPWLPVAALLAVAAGLLGAAVRVARRR
jgi:hypothetical protein